MKIRLDFVTNSSSSSFVLAIKKDVTKEKIKNILLENKNILKNFIENEVEYIKYIKEINKTSNMKEKINKLAELLSDGIMDIPTIITIDNWNIGTGICSNEDDLLSMYMYSYGIPENEYIKFRTGD